MKSKSNSTITTMISGDTILKVIQLKAESFSLGEAARILDIDADTLRSRGVNLSRFAGYSKPRVSRRELMRLLSDSGVRTPQEERKQSMASLPASVRKKIEKLNAEAGLA